MHQYVIIHGRVWGSLVLKYRPYSRPFAMWKVALIVGLFAAIAGSCKGESVDNAEGAEEVVSAIPDEETGNRVAKWKPEDGVNPEELGDNYLEGDIIINPKTRNGLKAESSRWKNGIVPYTISDDFNYKEYNTIMAAIEEYHKLTCIKWVRWSGEKDYVHFSPSKTGCWSSVGKVGGKQELNLQTPGCLTKKGTVIHEMLHALGFLHEQNRHERDKYVTIKWQNVQKGRENNFEKASKETTDGQGVTYDFGSVMHYSAKAFSTNGQPTIVSKVKNVEFGQREGLSRGDIKKIQSMYKCGGRLF